MRILIYAFVMIFAIIIGEKGILKKVLKERVHIIQSILIVALLFLMGVKLGNNEKFKASLSTIWINAIIMTLAMCIGSVIFLYIGLKIYNYFKNKKNRKDDE